VLAGSLAPHLLYIRNEKELLRIWVDEVLRDENLAKKMSALVTEGMIFKLHKGGSTTEKTKDWRPDTKTEMYRLVAGLL
jgi:hypothetical protein